ncbi:MAG: hypothetical protein ACP5IC_02530 [Minisyncoccia bacterium]
MAKKKQKDVDLTGLEKYLDEEGIQTVRNLIEAINEIKKAKKKKQ